LEIRSVGGDIAGKGIEIVDFYFEDGAKLGDWVTDGKKKVGKEENKLKSGRWALDRSDCAHAQAEERAQTGAGRWLPASRFEFSDTRLTFRTQR
jgi:hypothetical protein